MKKGTKELELTAREFELLHYMAEHAGCVISREQLYEAIWKEDSFGCDNTVMVHIRHLRKKLLPLQIAGTTVPYPFTFLQAVLINLGILYLILFAMTGLTLALSAHMKSPFAVLTVLVPVLFIPVFLTPNGTSGMYNLTLFLLPYRAAMPELGKYISYQAGGVVMDVLTVRAVLYTGLTAVFLPVARAGFRKHQVSA